MKGRQRALAVAALGLLALVGCGSSGTGTSDVLKIGAYSVVREAFHEGVIPAFQARWKQETGRDVQFQESYSASGAQARSIASGFDADLAVLSHLGDMKTLVDAGRVASDWDANPRHGILTNSVVVIGFREGNPRGVADWADLGKPGVGVLYPDPKTSGGARWNINAIYGAGLLAAGQDDNATPDPGRARELLGRIQKNVVNMDASGRQSMATFSEQQIGDAVVTYENEVLLRKREGKPIPFVVPDATLLIESPVALVKSSLERHGNETVARAFLDFLVSDEGQAILADYGFRPVDPAQAEKAGFQRPAKLFSMADLGGWEKVQTELYGPNGVWTSLFNEQGGK